MIQTENADILENILRRKDELLDILLIDRTTKRKIIWATDSYMQYGEDFAPKKQMKSELVIGKRFDKLIQPRVVKSREEQRRRTRENGEVFTPLRIVKRMNKKIDQADNFVIDESNWQEYVAQLKLEIACGEAPFIVTRYDPVAHGIIEDLKNRVGFLDRKLRVISEYCNKPKEWLKWVKVAYQSSYGYEWQGDSLLIARENLLYTLIDYYKAKFSHAPPLKVQHEFAEIISWNIFQMDGIKYVIPMSCHPEKKVTQGKLKLFGETSGIVNEVGCEGCKFNLPTKHNGNYVKIMDWEKGRAINFNSLVV